MRLACLIAILLAAPCLRADGPLELRLTQQSPVPGGPNPYTTSVTVAVEPDRLVFRFDCADPAPSRIAVHTMSRDGDLEGDDSVTIVLDPYGDRRTGYYFQVNAAGARVDGLIAGPEHPSLDWDGIWDARTTRTTHGWGAEIVIPARSLNFARGLSAWGLNLERYVARDRLTLRWHSPTLDSFLVDLSRAGTLEGVDRLRQGSGWEFSPFAVGRMKNGFAATGLAWQSQIGGDVTWHITPQLAAVFTANTDFAETEVDSRQLNVTRFPLFFPEKRSFFLEGSNQFEFGLGLGSTFIPFFSRRIGLLEGRQIPINGGVKLNGRIGKWNVGLLDVQTRASAAAPAANLLAARVSYDLTSQLRVGGIFTNGSPDGVGRNALTGIDGVWRTSKFRGGQNLLIGAWTAFTRRDGRASDRSGWGYKIDYPNDRWDCYNQIHQFGEGLNPALGFLPRPGTRQLATGCTFAPRPRRDSRLHWIRQYRLRNYYTRADNLRGFNESWQYQFTPADITFDSGEQVRFQWAPQHEFLRLPFQIAEGVVIPAGDYRFQRFTGEFASSPHRTFGFGTEVSGGSFYNGSLTQHESSAGWTSPSGRLSASVGVEQNFARFPQGSFVQRLWQVHWTYAFNPNLAFNSFLQYDNESQNFGSNSRLRWTIRPGNDFFIVWNRNWQRLYLTPYDRPIIPESELLAVKLRWTFRP